MKVKFIHTLLLAAAFVSASGALVSCKDYESDDVQELKNLNADQVKKFNDQLDALQKQVGNDNAYLNQRINGLRDSLNSYADTTYVKNGINAVEKEFLNTLANTVTDVTVQGTYAPAFGSLDLPGYDANILATYYGNLSDVKFPVAEDGFSVNGQTTYAGDVVNNDGKDGNLGTLKVTINPNTVDASYLTFALQSSTKDYSDEIKLGTPTEDTNEETFGYTRSTALDKANVYLIPATVTADQAKGLDIDFNSSNLKAAIKQALKDHSTDKANIKALAKAAAQFIYENANNKAPRLGLATQYYTQINQLAFNSDLHKEQTRNIISVVDGETAPLKNFNNLNILATAVKPLSFNSFDGLSETVDEQINKIEDRILDDANKTGHYATVEDYLSQFNSAFAKYGDKFIDEALKPALLLKKDGADANVKAARGAGVTVEAGNYTLVPTTWTYELLAPAYKKYVSIKDAAGKTVEGENLNTTVDGSVRAINNVKLDKGTYTVLYEAIDYSGNFAYRTYTITVE